MPRLAEFCVFGVCFLARLARSLAISLTVDFDSPVMPRVRTSLSIPGARSRQRRWLKRTTERLPQSGVGMSEITVSNARARLADVVDAARAA